MIVDTNELQVAGTPSDKPPACMHRRWKPICTDAVATEECGRIALQALTRHRPLLITGSSASAAVQSPGSMAQAAMEAAVHWKRHAAALARARL